MIFVRVRTTEKFALHGYVCGREIWFAEGVCKCRREGLRESAGCIGGNRSFLHVTEGHGVITQSLPDFQVYLSWHACHMAWQQSDFSELACCCAIKAEDVAFDKKVSGPVLHQHLKFLISDAMQAAPFTLLDACRHLAPHQLPADFSKHKPVSRWQGPTPRPQRPCVQLHFQPADFADKPAGIHQSPPEPAPASVATQRIAPKTPEVRQIHVQKPWACCHTRRTFSPWDSGIFWRINPCHQHQLSKRAMAE